MKTKKNYYLLLAIGIWIVTISACKDDGVQPASITSQESNDLLFLREEEKLAMDIYSYAYAKYGNVVFGNITSSESTHTGKILTLINKYNLTDPVGNNPAGVFVNPDLQLLYTQLKQTVDSSESHALYVGATIEDLDIFDINRLEKHTLKTDILTVYGALKCGSRNHLRAFVGQLGTYVPQFLTEDEYQSIILGEHEQCGKYYSR